MIWGDNTMSTSHEIREKLIDKGASIVGYADLKDVPEENRKGLRYGVSIAVALITTWYGINYN